MTDFFYDWDDKVRGIWRQVIAECDPTEGIAKSQARDIAAERIRVLIDTGDLKVPIDSAIHAAIEKADADDGKTADRALKAIVNGDPCLELAGDPILDLVVKLGAGKRKPWRYVDLVDLREMELARYRNLRNAQNSYDEFRSDFDQAVSVLSRFPNLGVAVDAGGFLPPSQPS